MAKPILQHEDYRTQIRRLARAMATADKTSVHGDLAEGYRPDQVAMFVDGNFDKRVEKLQKQLETVADAFDDFEELLVAFVKARPLAAYDTGASDGEEMLAWLEETQPLTLEQRDHVACQRARHAVEDAARQNRLAHVMFQDLLGLSRQLIEELPTNPDLRVHLNPVRASSRFRSRALLDDDTELPADVLFFPVGGDISTALLDTRGRALMNELATLAPTTLESWSALSANGDREDLTEITRDLAEMGLVAFG